MSRAVLFAVTALLAVFGFYATAKEPDAPERVKRVAFELARPKPLWIGQSPRIDPVEWPHLAKSRVSQTRKILAPKGAVNLALDAPVTASAEVVGGGEGGLELITDGELDGLRENITILPPGLQWVQIDLKQRCEIHGVALWHHFHRWGLYHDVIVQISDDPEFKKGVTTLFNNDHDATSGLAVGAGEDSAYQEWSHGLTIPLKAPKKARYLRSYAGGDHFSGMNYRSEIMVIGTRLKK